MQLCPVPMCHGQGLYYGLDACSIIEALHVASISGYIIVIKITATMCGTHTDKLARILLSIEAFTLHICSWLAVAIQCTSYIILQLSRQWLSLSNFVSTKGGFSGVSRILCRGVLNCLRAKRAWKNLLTTPTFDKPRPRATLCACTVQALLVLSHAKYMTTSTITMYSRSRSARGPWSVSRSRCSPSPICVDAVY